MAPRASTRKSTPARPRSTDRTPSREAVEAASRYLGDRITTDVVGTRGVINASDEQAKKLVAVHKKVLALVGVAEAAPGVSRFSGSRYRTHRDLTVELYPNPMGKDLFYAFIYPTGRRANPIHETTVSTNLVTFPTEDALVDDLAQRALKIAEWNSPGFIDRYPRNASNGWTLGRLDRARNNSSRRVRSTKRQGR